MICTIFCRNSAVVSRDQGRLALAAAAISSSSPSSASAPFEFRVTSTSGREIQDASTVPPREAPRVKREQFVPLELAEQKVRRLWSAGFPTAARESARLYCAVLCIVDIPISRPCLHLVLRPLAADCRHAARRRAGARTSSAAVARARSAAPGRSARNAGAFHRSDRGTIRWPNGRYQSRDQVKTWSWSIQVSFSLEPVKYAFCLVLAFPRLQEVKSQARERDASNKELARWLVDESQQQVCVEFDVPIACAHSHWPHRQAHTRVALRRWRRPNV
jgi:hypothetical protein